MDRRCGDDRREGQVLVLTAADFHPSAHSLEGFLRGSLDAELTREIAMHLLEGCSQCQARALRRWEGTLESGEAKSYGAGEQPENVLDFADFVEAERNDSVELLAELTSRPLGAGMMLVVGLPSFHSWALAENLIDRAYDLRFDDVAGLINHACLAVAVCQQLDSEAYGRPAIHDLQARAWSHLGNGFSILAEFQTSEACFAKADQLLELGTGDPLELAMSLRLRVGLRLRQHRFAEGRRLCQATRELFDQVGDSHHVGESWVLQGNVEHRADMLKDATACFSKALECLDPRVDPHMPHVVRHNLVLLLHESGQSDKAYAEVDETLRGFRELGDRQAYLKFKRVQAAIAAAIDLPHVAEQCLLEARNGFIATGMAARAAIAALELAQLYLQHGNFAETRRVAEQLLPILQVRGLHEEALAALLVFREAAIKERLTSTLLDETVKLVQKRHADA